MRHKAGLARYAPPKIYSGTGGLVTWTPRHRPGRFVEATNKTMGFRFMGQRFVPDSYTLGKQVFPTVGQPTRDGMFTYVMSDAGPIHGFPRGLWTSWPFSAASGPVRSSTDWAAHLVAGRPLGSLGAQRPEARPFLAQGVLLGAPVFLYCGIESLPGPGVLCDRRS
jgi:hypothetical protein